VLSNELNGVAQFMGAAGRSCMVVIVIMTTLCAACLAFCILFLSALHKDNGRRYEHICYLVVLRREASQDWVVEITEKKMSSSQAA